MTEQDLKLIQQGEIRVRMAPSPTGPFHIGSARTALFNYLFAKKHKGIFVLRIEDTDKERSKPIWEENIKESLEWLGIIPDESPSNGGNFGPYRQSERLALYEKYLRRLLEEGKIYYCFCSPEELESHRQYLMSQGKPPVYSGKCLTLTKEEVQKKLAEKKPFVLRFKTENEKIVFEDLLRGKIEYDGKLIGDFVVAKDFNQPLYNIACVIDDFEMKITHIIRGEEHISNTPRQILMAKALGIENPQFLHLPLILNRERAKLSKRDPNITAILLDYEKQGYLPEAMVNFLALLGWNPDTDKEIFSINTLIKEFSIDKIQKSGAVFNVQKLDWINGFYIRHKSLDKLTELCVPYLIQAGLIIPVWGQKEIIPLVYSTPFTITEFEICSTKEKISFESLKNIVHLHQERLKKLSEIAELTDFFFKKQLDYPKELLKWKDMEEKELKDILDKLKKVLSRVKNGDWTKETLEKTLMAEANEIGLATEAPVGTKVGDRGRLLWPFRAALSGKQASAGPFEIAAVLGKEKTLGRIKEAGKIVSRK